MFFADIDISKPFLSALGFIELRWKTHLLIRAGVLFTHAAHVAIAISTRELSTDVPLFRDIQLAAQLLRNFQLFYLYLDRCMQADRIRLRASYERRTVIVMIVTMFVHGAAHIADLTSDDSRRSLGSRQFESAWFVTYSSQFCYIFNMIEAVVLCAELADEISKGARMHDDIMRDLNALNAAEKCRESLQLCNNLSERLGGPLMSIYVEFFIRFVSRIPTEASTFHCASKVLLFVCKTIVHLSGFLSIIHEGNRILSTNKKSRRRIQLTESYLGKELKETRLYVSTEQGVRLWFGIVLGWKSLCSLIELTWQFAFMGLQIVYSLPNSRREEC